MPANPTATPVTVPELARFKRDARKIVALTAYDASFAACADQSGIDFILVGDSLGMVMQGRSSTLPVSVDDIVYHSACAARGIKRALLVADLPFMAYRSAELALANSARLIAEGGSAMVKLEGGGWVCEVIETLRKHQIPVCAHLGLTPQSVHAFGGFRVQGREDDHAAAIKADALAVEAAGADALVLECVPAQLAREITKSLRIPTIGIGAGVDCDGQILVLHDMLGVASGKRPRFTRDFLAGSGSISAAMRTYADAVHAGTFPTAEHSY